MGVVFECLRSNGHGMPFFFALAQDFCYARHNEQAHSALAYSKKSLHWDLRCFSGGIVFIDVLGILDAALSRFLN